MSYCSLITFGHFGKRRRFRAPFGVVLKVMRMRMKIIGHYSDFQKYVVPQKSGSESDQIGHVHNTVHLC